MAFDTPSPWIWTTRTSCWFFRSVVAEFVRRGCDSWELVCLFPETWDDYLTFCARCELVCLLGKVGDDYVAFLAFLVTVSLCCSCRLGGTDCLNTLKYSMGKISV
ncbi:uncharacterized protein BDV17DRAFT_253096, partial [Aspergillus undulatus]|uniref:uncharacterized protein n=1 Tax=Aspergillus undulatus TaxID=1810928 RepID=UPI003CCD8EB1